MILNRIILEKFRCYSSANVCFSKGVNIIFGNNSVGKTALLEAISVLCLSKSFRGSSDIEMCLNNGEKYALKGDFLTKNSEQTVILLYSNYLKKIKRNNEWLKTLSEHVGNLPIICCGPSDLMFFYGGASYRRRFMNLLLCQLSKKYLFTVSDYNKILNERNAFLKKCVHDNKVNYDLLDVLTIKLIVKAKEIIQMRTLMISDLNKNMTNVYSNLFGVNDEVKVLYTPNIDFKTELDMYKKVYNYEIKKGTTLYGPHKDDYIFIINNKNIANYGSQGQQKGALLSAKLSLIDPIYNTKGMYPIVLLDDVFSEFDPVKQNNLFKIINKVSQVLVTSATLSDINKEILDEANIIHLTERGKI